MHVTREPVELCYGDRARLSVAAGASQGGGELRAAVERVGALARLDLRELGGDLEALGLGEADDELREHGAAKVIPSARQLADAYRLFKRGAEDRRAVEALLASLARETIAEPADLEDRVRAYLAEHPEASWDEAVEAIAREPQ